MRVPMQNRRYGRPQGRIGQLSYANRSHKSVHRQARRRRISFRAGLRLSADRSAEASHDGCQHGGGRRLGVHLSCVAEFSRSRGQSTTCAVARLAGQTGIRWSGHGCGRHHRVEPDSGAGPSPRCGGRLVGDGGISRLPCDSQFTNDAASRATASLHRGARFLAILRLKEVRPARRSQRPTALRR